MTSQRIPHVDTRYLPRLCDAPGCTRDPVPGKRKCRKCHAILNRQSSIRRKRGHAKREPDNVWVYFIRAERGPIKIGFSAQHPDFRAAQLQTASVFRLVVMAVVRCRPTLERELRAIFAADRVCGEWFRPSVPLRKAIAYAAKGDMDGFYLYLARRRTKAM